MKGIVSVFAVLTLAGAAFAQQTQVYTPAASDPNVPTFMNGEVVRVDPIGRTITVRSEGRDAVLSVEGEGLTGLSRLHAGDQVMLGYRADSRDGRAIRIVTNIREVMPAPAPPTGAASRSTTLESVRVVAVNPSKRTLTVADGTGARRVVSVTPDVAKSLRQVRAGDEVVLSYRVGKGRTRTVIRVEPVGVSASGAATQVGAVSSVVSPAADPRSPRRPPRRRRSSSPGPERRRRGGSRSLPMRRAVRRCSSRCRTWVPRRAPR